MTEYDVLLIGAFLIGSFGGILMFTAVVDGRSLVAPALMVIIACGLIYLAIGESPTGTIAASDIPQAFVKLAATLTN